MVNVSSVASWILLEKEEIFATRAAQTIHFHPWSLTVLPVHKSAPNMMAHHQQIVPSLCITWNSPVELEMVKVLLYKVRLILSMCPMNWQLHYGCVLMFSLLSPISSMPSVEYIFIPRLQIKKYRLYTKLDLDQPQQITLSLSTWQVQQVFKKLSCVNGITSQFLLGRTLIKMLKNTNRSWL